MGDAELFVACPVDGNVGEGPVCSVCGSVLPGLVELEVLAGDEPQDGIEFDIEVEG